MAEKIENTEKIVNKKENVPLQHVEQVSFADRVRNRVTDISPGWIRKYYTQVFGVVRTVGDVFVAISGKKFGSPERVWSSVANIAGNIVSMVGGQEPQDKDEIARLKSKSLPSYIWERLKQTVKFRTHKRQAVGLLIAIAGGLQVISGLKNF